MKKIILLCFSQCLILPVTGRQYTTDEKIMMARLDWLYKVKEFAARQSWPEFAGKQNEIALVYFTDSSSYVIDPEPVLQQRITTTSFCPGCSRAIRETAKRIDDRPFHMETAMDTKDSSAVYFNYPVMMCSSYEDCLTRIPGLDNLQEWIAMVIHEYFHGFQFRHPQFTAYGDSAVNLRGSQLQTFYDQYGWFKKSVDTENQLLLDCLEKNRPDHTDSLLNRFYSLRENRRKRLEDSLHNDFARQEDFYEKLEGSAKYVELGLVAAYKYLPPDHQLQLLDTAYKRDAYEYFDLNAEKWRYSPGSVSYYYATGYNLLRVLDQLGIRYKKNFFDDNTLSPYGLLRAYITYKTR